VPAAVLAIIAFVAVAYLLDNGDLKRALTWARPAARRRLLRRATADRSDSCITLLRSRLKYLATSQATLVSAPCARSSAANRRLCSMRTG
jgi:hypothetical protein